jgi:hypothetical protein
MRSASPLLALVFVVGSLACRNDCGMTFPDQHLLTVSGERLQCCGDSRHYDVAQATNDSAVDIVLQAAAAMNGGPIAGLRLSVAISHCEPARQGDCSPVADRTTPSKAAGDYAVASEATASVSGHNIRLAITVTNEKEIPGKLYLDVTQGTTCPAPL